jgi:DNA gyrase subunit A
MINFLETGKPKKLKPYNHGYTLPIERDERRRLLFRMGFEQKGDKIFITELPRSYDAPKIYKYLSKYIESGFIKDFTDSSVDNDVNIELIFKRGSEATLADVEKEMGTFSSQVPNYTLISERGVRIFERPEEIIEIFSGQRLEVVKKRYDLRCRDLENKIEQNNEIIKFIKKKEYEVATKSKNRKSFVEYLGKKKYVYSDYLADMPIYRMTKEEVAKRVLMVKDDKKLLAEYSKIAKSPRLVKKKLIEELKDVGDQLTAWLKAKDKERSELRKKIEKKTAKKKAVKKKRK